MVFLSKISLMQKSVVNVQRKIAYAEELNPEQLQVVHEGDGPCLVLAGAGSGKTRTLVYRVAYLIEQGVPAHQILLLTFTNKAASEMLMRVERLLEVQKHGIWGGTFHAISNRILRRFAEHLSYTKTFNIIDEEDAKRLMKQCMSETTFKGDKSVPKAEVLKSLVSFSKNSCLSLEEVCRERYFLRGVLPALEEISALYEQKKRQMNVMDFDDLLMNWHTLLLQFPEIGGMLQEQFHYILVDEYQDTNKLQGRIIDGMAERHKNVLVVGDDAQSIYSFRAATVTNILEFPQRFPLCRIFRLETNYRSTPEILCFANESIKKNKSQFPKQLRSVCEKAGKPRVVVALDAFFQAQFICNKVVEYQREGHALEEVAVLVRSSYQTMELELELNKRGIPYIMRGGIRFFEQAHVKDVISYVKILVNIRDELAWLRVLQLYDGIGLMTAQKLLSFVRKADSLEDLRAALAGASVGSSTATKNMQKILFLLSHLKDLSLKHSLASLLKSILRQGYSNYIEHSFERPQERFDDIEQLIQFSQVYKRMEDFLADVALSEGFSRRQEGRRLQNQSQSLLITTIHQAKGLEWQCVFLLGLAEGQFPHYKAFEKKEHLEEERRLFYVACTRAKEILYMTYPIFVGRAVNGALCRPSSFLTEIHPRYYDRYELEDTGDMDVS